MARGTASPGMSTVHPPAPVSISVDGPLAEADEIARLSSEPSKPLSPTDTSRETQPLAPVLAAMFMRNAPPALSGTRSPTHSPIDSTKSTASNRRPNNEARTVRSSSKAVTNLRGRARHPMDPPVEQDDQLTSG